MVQFFARASKGEGYLLSSVVCLGIVFVGGCSKATAPVAAPFFLPSAGAPTDTSLSIGDSFPEIETVDIENQATNIDRKMLGDRYTLVVFWSTWCGFCMQDLPHQVELAERHGKNGLGVIGVNADDSIAVAKKAVEENKVSWVNVYEGPEKSISNRLGIKEWPAMLLLDSEGKVVTATKQLRSIAVETLPDGSVRPISGLDWAVRELLEKKRL